jgi:NAD(P)-dependent dehydrogenase (short-subunit alcohol dehydrogenase family)
MAEERKVVWVTGASTGIGRATAVALAGAGWRVFGTGRDPSRVAPITGVEFVALDVRSDDSVRACHDTILARAGRIDALVNNAGYLQAGAVEEVSLAELAAQFETNVHGALRTMQAVLPAMRARGSGRIVNITSLAGEVPLPFWGAYNASKAALESLTETLRLEVSPFGVHVSAVEPGAIKTPFYDVDRRAAPIAAYTPWRARFERTMAGFAAAAPGPEAVADAVLRALSASRPALRWRVTREAFLFTTLRRLLPGWMFELGVRRGMGLDGADPVPVSGGAS